MFNDRARIRVQAGRGGDGSLHFRREKHVPKGGPDGGDGGPGGDVVLVADPDLRDLSAFRSRRSFKAGRGEPGRGALKHGATGETVEVRVPVGTQVLDEDGQLIALLARISNARPKIADYPFTTLAPVLGTVDSPDGARQLTVADVPGLIEGASEGAGLGHEFLAHLERANLLLHVIDSAEDDAAERFVAIDRELAAYGAGLEARPQAIVLNKIDLRADEPVLDLEDERIVRVFRVSCATGTGIEELRRA